MSPGISDLCTGAHSALPLPSNGERKSGQHRAPLFLTGRGLFRKEKFTASAAERDTAGVRVGKGEKVG